MHLNLRNLAPLGFKGGAMTGPTSISLLWRVQGNVVQYASGYTPQSIGLFHLTPALMRRFVDGKLILSPPGFCSPTAGRTPVCSDPYATYQGRVRSKAHLEQLLEDMAP